MRWTTGLRLWLAWVVANGLGGQIGFAAGGAVTVAGVHLDDLIWSREPPRTFLAMTMTVVWFVCWPLVTGAVVTAAQWIAVRRYATAAITWWGWVRQGALLWLGGGVAAGLSLFVIEMTHGPMPGTDLTRLELIVSSALLGLVVGIGQCLTLGRTSPRSWIWPPAVLGGYIVGALVGGAAVNTPILGPAFDWDMDLLIVRPAVAGLTGGFVSGTITGAALVWMLAKAYVPEAA